MDSAADSRKQSYDFAKQVQADCSKLLDNSNLSPKMIMEILNRESELVKMANEKDSEIREQEKEIEDKVNKKIPKKENLTGNLWVESAWLFNYSRNQCKCSWRKI